MLLYFEAVADELSFTRGARRLGIDQSWLSHKIRQIEERLGVALFRRSTRHVELTSAGRALLGPVRKLAAVAAESQQAAEMIREGISGSLRIGALPYSFSDPQRVRFINDFLAEHPKTRLAIVNGASPALIEKLHAGEIDLAFVSAPFDATGLEALHLRRECHVVLLPVDDALADKDSLTFEDLAGRRLVVPSERHNPEAFARYYRPFLNAGAIAVQPPEFETAASYAARWRLAAVCSASAASTMLGNGFVSRPISAGQSFACDKYLVRIESRPSSAQDGFWDYVESQLPKRSDPSLH
jgi:DNA-binding transcriptional LysR family regulator